MQSNLNKLYDTINLFVFDDALPRSTASNFALKVSNKMSRSYGSCLMDRRPDHPTHVIKISGKIAKFENGKPGHQLLLTLVHEMVHMQMHIADGDMRAAHGWRWRKAFLDATKRYDENFRGDDLHTGARTQVFTQYNECNEHNNKAIASNGVRQHKWTLTCPVCGYVHKADRLGRILQLAVSREGVRHGKNADCTARLIARRNY